MKLGEVLVGRGIITQEELQEGLKAQLVFGGHVGTCLIELGYLDEDDLGGVLAESFKVEYAHRDRLTNIPEPILKTVPRKLVERHKAVPFDLQGHVLQVAIVDPTNFLALDELAFVSGHRIQTWIAPALMIFRAMERYYEIPVQQRYIALSRELERKWAAKQIQTKMPKILRLMRQVS